MNLVSRPLCPQTKSKQIIDSDKFCVFGFSRECNASIYSCMSNSTEYGIRFIFRCDQRGWKRHKSVIPVYGNCCLFRCFWINMHTSRRIKCTYSTLFQFVSTKCHLSVERRKKKSIFWLGVNNRNQAARYVCAMHRVLDIFDIGFSSSKNMLISQLESFSFFSLFA